MFIQLNLQWAFLSVFKKYFYIQRILVNIFLMKEVLLNHLNIFIMKLVHKDIAEVFFNIMALVL